MPPIYQLLGLGLIVLFVLVLVAGATLARTRPALRPLSGYRALPKQLGRAVEGGQSLHLSLGSGGVGGSDTATTLAGLAILGSLAEEAAATDTPLVVTLGDPTAMVVAQDYLRRAYTRQGNVESYNPRSVRFVAPSPLPYAAGVLDILSREEMSVNVMAGVFGPEVAFIAEGGAKQNLVQIGGAADPAPLSVLYPTADHLLVGEELFVAGAYMTDQPAQASSLIAQDVIRWILAIGILLASVPSLVTLFVALLGGQAR